MPLRTTGAAELYFAEPKHLGPQDKEVSRALKEQTEAYLRKPIETLSSTTAGSLSSNDNLIVAIGPQALEEVLAGPGTAPVVAVFISMASFTAIRENLSASAAHPFSAIFSNPDPLKQVVLSQVLFGSSARSAIISTPRSQPYIKDYKDAAAAYGLNLNVIDYRDIKTSADFIHSTKSSDLIFLLKDPVLFETFPLDKILLSSYDINHQAIIGYSSGLVKNGAVATTFSSIDNIAQSIYEQANKIEGHNPLSEPHYTTSFEITLNTYVIRSLDIPVKSLESVKTETSLLIHKGRKP